MRKIIGLLLVLLFAAVSAVGQVPSAFKYQAVLRDMDGAPLPNTSAEVVFKIFAADAVYYEETHSVTTNQFGLVSLNVGQGESTYDFDDIPWGGTNSVFMEVLVDGVAYGSSNFLSVPYALRARTVDSVDVSYFDLSDLPDLSQYITEELDADPLNEIQTLSIDGSVLSLSGGGSVQLPVDSFGGSYNDLTDLPELFTWDYDYNDLINTPELFTWDYDYNDLINIPTLFGGSYNDLTDLPVLFSGNYNDLTDLPVLFTWDYDYGDLINVPDLFSGSYNDLTDKPELFTWDYDYNDLINTPELFGGSYNDLTDLPGLFSGSYADLTDKPDLSIYLTEEVDSDASNELQELSISNDTIYLSDGGAVKLPAGFSGDYADLDNKPDLSGYLTEEADGSATNEIQTISRTGTTVTLSNGGGSFEDSVNVYTAGTGIDITDNVISVSGGGSGGHYVGEFYGGGLVFHVTDGGEHGLIVSLEDVDNPADLNGQWVWNETANMDMSNTSLFDGEYNTDLIINHPNFTDGAAKACADYAAGGFTDWYLPSLTELRLLFIVAATVDYVLENDGDGSTKGFTVWDDPTLKGVYWTSSQYWNGGSSDQIAVSIMEQTNWYRSETHEHYVRAIRRF